MKTKLFAAAMLLLTGSPAFAHRLDEYLQATIVSVEKNRVDLRMTLTPGVAVFPALIAEIDADGDGVISGMEQNVYADRVRGDLSLRIDDEYLSPQLRAMAFPTVEEMKQGRGEIRIDITADLPPGGRSRKLILENRHESHMAAYQVNCLIPRDPGIRILAQKRNYSQSSYELDFDQPGANSGSPELAGSLDNQGPPGVVAVLLVAFLGLLWWQRNKALRAPRR